MKPTLKAIPCRLLWSAMLAPCLAVLYGATDKSDTALSAREDHRPLPPPGVIEVMDLASDSEWTLSPDDGPKRPVKVPGGGWNSDRQVPPIQVMREVKDFVRYQRTITIPTSAQGQSVQLRFGAVAHGCEVYLDGVKVGEHHGPQVPFSIDLTGVAVPGRHQLLEIKAFHRRHYLAKDSRKTAEIAVGWDYPDGDDEPSRSEAKTWCNWRGQSKVAYGIGRSIALEVLPAVHVEAVFVRPSVSAKQLACDVWVRNDSEKPKDITVGGCFSSWNHRDWHYPAVKPVTAIIPAHSTRKISLPAMDWNLGEESYWWPNIPFRENYLAQLHFINLQLKEGDRLLQTYPQRFGFVEHAEGPNYYTVNGIRVTGISDATAEGQVSFYDSYSSPAWLPPTSPGTGAPESWRRYMRLGINSNRLHCSPPTEYMLQTADELGFMLIPEAPIWGNGLSRYSPLYTPQTYHDLGRACRNHPSVARYSLANEVREKRDLQWPWRSAIDDMREVDDVHPLSFELHRSGNGRVEGVKGGHAWIMEHYGDIHEKVGPEKGIRGMGEHFWHTDMGLLAVGIRTLRVNDWCYMSGWSWLNYWPNFLQGMGHDLHAWKENNHPDRHDGVDGWGSPIVRFTQQSLHPYLVQDLGVLAENPGAPVVAGNNGEIRWPYDLPVCVAGDPVERVVEVFNGGLRGNSLSLRWIPRWDSPEGPVAATGGDIPCSIEPGFHSPVKITFTAPQTGDQNPERTLCLVLESRKDGEVVFRDEALRLRVMSRSERFASATYQGTDDSTKGSWQGRYGTEGHDLAGKECEMPAARRFAWLDGKVFIYQNETEDPRALQFFQNDTPNTPHDRIAASRYGRQISLTLDAGETPRRLSLYFVDWDQKKRVQEIEIQDESSSKMLDKRVISDFSGGCYQSWKVKGKIRVVIRRIRGDNATVSGVFIDQGASEK